MKSKSAEIYRTALPFNHPMKDPLPPSRCATYVVENFEDKADTIEVLDAGCGRGRNTLYLLGKGFRVTAVDVSEENLTLLKEQAISAGLNLDRLRLLRGDIFTKGFIDDASFDIALDVWVSGSVMQYHDGRQGFMAYLQMLHRVLKPDGLLLSEFETLKPRRQAEDLVKYFSNAADGMFTIRSWEPITPDYAAYIDRDATPVALGKRAAFIVADRI